MSITKSSRIVFAGTPDFASVALQALIEAGYNVIAVYTQPDRPAGRGRHLTASPVKEYAQSQQLPVYQPISLREQAEQHVLAELKADIMIVAAYGLILPSAVLATPVLGCINIHASLLPRWRGAAPIQRAILAGDHETGITIMQMDEGLDTGNMLHKKMCNISSVETSASLHDKLAHLGAEALLETLVDFKNKRQQAQVQDHSQKTYAKKIIKAEGCLDWNLPASVLERQVRGFNPWPVACFMYRNEIVRVWKAQVLPGKADVLPGTVCGGERITVATGDGLLLLQQLQLPGRNIVSAMDLIHARSGWFINGDKLD